MLARDTRLEEVSSKVDYGRSKIEEQFPAKNEGMFVAGRLEKTKTRE